MNYGMSEMGKLINAAKVATKKAEITKRPDDWEAAARAWRETDIGVERADFCEQMAEMLRELESE